MWEGRQSISERQSTSDFSLSWFESRLSEVRAQVELLYKQFRLSEALKIIYSLIWDDFCSWYLEWVKPGFEENIDAEVYNKSIFFFEELLQMLHPFMPFISEEIYHLLKEQNDDLTVKQFAHIGIPEKGILKQADTLKEFITSVRDARNKNNIKPKDKIKLYIETSAQSNYSGILSILSKQLNAEEISFVNAAVAGTITVVVGNDKIYAGSENKGDSEAQRKGLLKDLDYLKGFLISVDNKLKNDRFVQNAKAEVIEIERKKKADTEAKIRTIEESLATLIKE